MRRTRRPRDRHALWARALLAVAVVLAIVVVRASPASAHSTLVSANPAAGASLPQAPGTVVLEFSEAIDHFRSSVAVTGPGGSDATTGPTQVVPNDERTLRRPLGLEPPGRYDVAWIAVSIDDGHVESGRYSFGIGMPAPATRESSGGAVSSEGLLGLSSQLLLVVGLTFWVGARLIGRSAIRAGVAPSRVAAVRRASPALVLFAVVVRAGATAARAPTLGRIAPTVLAGRAGVFGTLLVAVAAVIGLLAHRRAPIAATAVGVALIAQAAAGHAGGAPFPVVAVGVLAVHLAAVGVWLFAIAATLLARRLSRALAILSPYAVASAVIAAVTGVGSAALERVDTGELVTTGYGHVLLAKGSVFVVVAGLGGWQAQRRRARARAPKLRMPTRLEAGAAGVALIVATILAASPPPTSFSPATGSGADSALGALDGRNALSIADATGPYVVGLTISPPRPGPVTTRVEILSADANDVFSEVAVHASAAGGPSSTVSMRPVGPGLFAGDGRIERNGDWSFGVSFVARGVLNQVTLAVTLPAPDGAGELAEAFAADERLTSAQLHETLRAETGSAPIIADYRFRAPDSFAITVNGTHQVDIGALAYRQDEPGGPWTIVDTGLAFGWPFPYFRQAWANATAVRVVGADVVDGVPTHIVAFVRPDLPAWFELWIGDADGLVRREEMRAEGHLMRHDYAGFDAPTSIDPPG